MATLVVIPDCEYATFEAIRDEIFDKCPFALMSNTYAGKRKEAHFFFHDTKYIPNILLQYAMLPDPFPYDFSKIKLPKKEK